MAGELMQDNAPLTTTEATTGNLSDFESLLNQ